MRRYILLSTLFVTISARAPAADAVHLKDGSVFTGEVLELGTSTIELVMTGGVKRILKRDIEKVLFDQDRSRKEMEKTDVLVRKDGHRIRGKIEVLDGGQRVQITLDGGAKAIFPRKDVLRLIKGGEAVERDTTVYTRELGNSISEALAVLNRPGEPAGEARKSTKTTKAKGTKAAKGAKPAETPKATETPKPAETPKAKETPKATETPKAEPPPGSAEAVKFLTECGIFAIQPVREALAKAHPDSPGAQVLRRIDHQYRLRETVDPAIEAAESRVYQILTEGSVREKCDFLIIIFPRYVEESMPLAMLLAMDGDEDPTVRAWSVEFLRRMQKNWQLLDVYRRSTGQVQLAAAIALGKNRILLGIPTLIEALDFDSIEIREVAGKQLRDLTGQDFIFRADGAPQARKEAIQKWQAWWQGNAERLTLLAESTLRSDKKDTPERKAAMELWRHAGASIDSNDMKGAEQLLRQSMQMDPGFYQAQVTLAVLLYTGLEKPQEAVKLLEDARTRLASQLVPEERQWIHLHLAHALRITGEIDRAAASYEQTRLLAPDNIQAWLGLAELKLVQAMNGQAGKPEDREKLLQSALEAAKTADSLLEKLEAGLTALRFEEIPAGVELPFDRREYNRSVMDLRKRFRGKQQQLHFTAAKAKCLLGDKKEGILDLRRAIDDLAVDALKDSKKLEADMRTFLGTLYEEMGQPLLALKEYRKVLKDVDPQHEESKRGIERLKRHARQGSEASN